MKNYLVEEDFMYKGHRCVVLFLSIGHRCGYVEVGREYYDNDKIDCHGGITFDDYSAGILPNADDKFHHFIGFDCGHYYDKANPKRAYRKKLITASCVKRRSKEAKRFGGVIRSKKYVKNECKRIVEQLVELD